MIMMATAANPVGTKTNWSVKCNSGGGLRRVIVIISIIVMRSE